MRLVAILLLASPARARVCESSDVARRSRTPDPKLTAAGFSGEFERPIVDWKIKGCFSLNARASTRRAQNCSCRTCARTAT